MNNKLSNSWGIGNKVNADSDGHVSNLQELWHPDEQSESAVVLTLEDRICQRANLSYQQLEQARAEHEKAPRKRLGQILLDMGLVQEEDLLACLAEQYGLPFIRLERSQVNVQALENLDRNFAASKNVLPFGMEGQSVKVAIADPTNIFLIDEIKRKIKYPVSIYVCPSVDLQNILAEFGDNSANYQVDDFIEDVDASDVELIDTTEEDIADLEKAAGDSPIIKFVNYIMVKAISEGASDLHIEPQEKKMRVRCRIDGILFEMITPPQHMHSAVVSRIKIMANLDISERRLPQDGRICVMIHGRNVDMRVSTLPTSFGEKVVIRVLDVGRTQLSLSDLGLADDTLTILDNQVHRPHGIVLVTGPTGSGKSTTLYGALRTMDLEKQNISTVEDPVEYQLDGVTQVQVHERIGMTFSAALRSLLRQDPDVIMVGEIRDGETAKIAIQASLTGHLVLSTLHTNDAPSSITRLINIGVESYLIAASLNAVLAQRLARKICRHCKVPYEPSAEHAGFMKLYGFTSDNMSRGVGCEVCRNTGYQGRVGLYELLAIDDTYRDIITKNPTVTELRRICKERGMVSLRDDGFRKVQAQLTTIEEVMRVTEATV